MKKMKIVCFCVIFLSFSIIPLTASAALMGQEIFGVMTSPLPNVTFTPNFSSSETTITSGIEFTGKITQPQQRYSPSIGFYFVDVIWDVQVNFTDTELFVDMSNGNSSHTNGYVYNLTMEFSGFNPNSWSSASITNNPAYLTNAISSDDNDALTLNFYGLTNGNWTIEFEEGASQVPVPSAIILLGTGLIGLVGVRKKMKK